MASKRSIQKQLTETKQALAILDRQRERAMNEARSQAYDEFEKEHQQELKSLREKKGALQAQLQALETQVFNNIPESLRKWLYIYNQGVRFDKDPLIIWWSENLQYIIVRYPGSTGYVDRMSGCKYSPSEYELLHVIPGKKYFDKDVKAMHFEGKITKEQKEKMIAVANELIRQETNGTSK
ncbi:MAG: hypothetical protein WC346_05370 [Methanogenium sp.]